MEIVLLALKECLLNVGFFILIIISALSLGQLFIKRFNLNKSGIPKLDSYVVSLGFGLGIIGYIAFALGIAGLIYKSVFYIVLIFFALLGIFLNRKIFLKARPSLINLGQKFFDLRSGQKVLIIFILIICCLNFVCALAPPTAQDALSSYLAIPKIFMNKHRIFNLQENYVSYIPLLPSIIYLFGLVLHSGVIAQLIHWLFGLLALIILFAIGKTFSITVGLLSSAIFLCIQPVVWESSAPLTDLATVFFLLLGFYAFVKWLYYEEVKWIILSGIALGFASACKGFGPIYTGAFGSIIFINSVIKKGIKEAIKIVTVFLFCVFSVVGIWYIRAYIMTGNPFFPAFFGGRGTTSEWLQGFENHGNPSIPGANLKNFFLFPFELTFSHSIYGGWIGPLFLAFLPWILFIKERTDKVVVNIFFYCMILFSFISILKVKFELRWYLILFALLTIPTGIVGCNFISSYKKRVASLSTVIVISGWFSFSLAYAIWKKLPNLAVAVGLESREHYLKRMIPEDSNYLEAFKFINKNVPIDTKILFLGSRGYYLDREYIRFWRLSTGMLDTKKINNSMDLLRELKKLKVTHILVDYEIAEEHVTRFNIQEGYKLFNYLKKLIFDANFQIIYQNNTCLIYEIR